MVQNDWTVRWSNAFLQLPRASQVQPGERVQVCEQRDGRVRLFAGERELSWVPPAANPAGLASPRRRALDQRSRIQA